MCVCDQHTDMISVFGVPRFLGDIDIPFFLPFLSIDCQSIFAINR